MAKSKKIQVQDVSAFASSIKEEDYITLIDIAGYRDADRRDYILKNRMHNRSTIEFLGLCEQLNNPDFNSIEFDGYEEQTIYSN